jgi:ABC-type antimicrobial peptide transport system permease subunit
VLYVDSFVESLGFYAVNSNMFILKQMQIFNYSTLLLGLVFNVILLVFIVISVLLIYSLLMIGVETKTLETGILRMLGTNKRGLIAMVFIHSILFVMPSVIAAFALCFPFIGLCYSKIFKEKLTDGFEPIPQPSAILQALAVGIFIPLVSAILPIMRVLS